ncbi:MAG: 3D domain-containing protein [Pyrinomonadaceae bacterium]
MKNLAGGITFLGAIMLTVMFLFYFQPTAEAVTLAIDSQQNTQQQLLNQQEQIQVQNTIEINNNKNNNNFSDSVSYRATAYCLQGRTATGGSVRRGIVAADTRILPLGTRIQVDAGSYSGTYTVADTGGAVRGRTLDIWVPSCSEARRFGSRRVKVSRMGRKS